MCDTKLQDGSDLDAVNSIGASDDGRGINPSFAVASKKEITEYHVLKIAAELLLDFC